MNMKISAPRTRRSARALCIAVAIGAGVFAPAVVSPTPAGAVACPLSGSGTCTATQTVTATVGAGSLGLSAPSTVALGAVTPGTTLTNQSTGTIAITDTLNVATNLSVTADVSDLVTGYSCPAGATGGIVSNWSNYTFNTGSVVFAPQAGATATTPVAGAGGTPAYAAASDTAKGCTFSGSAIPIASANEAAKATEGTYNMTGMTVNVVILGTAPAGAAQGTIQYTVIG